MVFFERIQKIIDYYGIKSVNSFAKDYLKYKSSEKINRLKGENTLPSYEILRDISIMFEEISPDWLLTGRGEMLRNLSSQPDECNKREKNCEKCAEKDKLIQSMQKTIDTQGELIDCLQSMQDICSKTKEKKTQIGTDFPTLSANL